MYRSFLALLYGLLAIEFLDELVFGALEVSWPQIRDELGLTYGQIGLLLALPGFSGPLIEPLLGLLADRGHRRQIVLGGGACFALALALMSQSGGYGALLAAVFLFGPASGAFVSLSQTVLMDAEPEQREKNMARWAFAGSAGMLCGPLLCGAAAWLGRGWREVLAALALASFPLVALAARLPLAVPPAEAGPRHILEDLRGVLHALRRHEVRRWLLLLALADLMMDVLHGFLALYLVDAAGASLTQAALALMVWTGVGLLGDLLLIRLLDHVPGLTYLRASAGLALVLFPAFLLAPGYPAKLVLLGLMGFFNAGWYSILQARLYQELPGRSGLVMALGSVSGLLGGLLPLGIGLAAERFGLVAAMGLLLLGPLALLLGLPWKKT